ncbi:quinone oxidoreductase family protein [Frigoribacterium sp. 2-23]|uniref:quinone oxidoreductase family protein n=1 Tax=Frigoribacterium sp. 2-23 TaxID=3415006 RepID=UPI003C6EF0FF
MRAIVVREAGSPSVLEPAEVDAPSPGPGQVLVTTAATGVNFIETYQRDGTYDVPKPFTPGAEASGTIAAVGEGVDDLRVGQRVTTAEAHATYAEQFVADAAVLVPVPDGVDDQTAAALPLQGYTAHYLMSSTVAVQRGQTVLVHAGAGGVGLLLTQLLKRAGATVITTVSTDDKEALSRQAGADHVLRYDGFATAVRDLTDGAGVPVVFDGVGRSTFDGSLDAAAVRGTVVLFGAASGPVPPVDPQRLNHGGSLFLTRPTMKDYLRTAEERRHRADDLFDAVVDGQLDVRVGQTYPLADAAAAHTDLQARKTTGKVLLLP